MSVKNIVKSGKNRFYSALSKHLKLYRIIAAVIAFAMIIGVIFLVNALLGFPLYYPFVKRKAEKYVEENYAAQGYVIESFSKVGEYLYIAEVAKPGSSDSRFNICYSSDGRMQQDTYDFHVQELYNVIFRLRKQYEDFANVVFESPLFPYSKRSSEAWLVFESHYSGLTYDSTIPLDILVLDSSYDIQELGEIGGYLDITIDTDQVTPEYAAEALLKIDSFLKRGGVTYYAIDLTLKNCSPEASGSADYCLDKFRRSDIYEDGLIERVTLAGKSVLP